MITLNIDEGEAIFLAQTKSGRWVELFPTGKRIYLPNALWVYGDKFDRCVPIRARQTELTQEQENGNCPPQVVDYLYDQDLDDVT